VLFPRKDVIRQLQVAVERLVVRPILRADLGRAAVSGGLDAPSLMDALVLHLLLTEEKQPDEPTPRTDRWKDGVILAGQKAAARWESLSGSQPASHAPRVVENLVRFYAAGIDDPAELADRERKFVSAARRALIGAGDDPLQEIINDPAMPRDLKLVEILGSAVVLFQLDEGTLKSSVAVRGAFTPAGYHVFKKRIGQMEKAQQSDDDDWILGRERKARDAKQLARLKADYFTQYLNAWKNFLLALAVREPTSLDEVRAVVKKLVADKPFEAIWRNITENLDLKDDSLLGKGLAAVKGKANAQLVAAGENAIDTSDADSVLLKTEFEGLLRFGSVKPTGFEQYNQVLVELSGAMGDSGTPDPKSFQSTLRTQRTILSNLIARYNDLGWEQGMLERILMPPLRGAESAIVGASGELANRKWCETVVVTFDQLLGGRFPFAAGKSSGEARVADLEKFFQPNTGVLWQYFNDSLQSDIERTGAVFRGKEGAAVRYKDEFLKFLGRAQELTNRLFSRNPSKLDMPVEVRIRPSTQYSKIVLDAGAKKIVGLNAVERWDEVPWPSRRAVLRLFVKTDEVESLGPRDEGEWALFRLLSQGQSPTKGTDFVTLSFLPTLGQGKVQVDVRPDDLRDLFSRFVLPRAITAGGGSCH
jgi:type VI protein secretion system component VasK